MPEQHVVAISWESVRLLWTLLALSAAEAADAHREFQTGVALFEQKRLTEAEAHLKEAVRQDASRAGYWKALGVVYASQTRYDQAEPAFRQACTLDQREPDACYFWARALYARERFAESLKALDRSRATEGASGRVEEAAGQACEGLGQSAEAERHFRAAYQSDTRRHALAWGRFLIREGRTEEALPVLQRAVRDLPHTADAHFECGRALLQLGRLDDAITALFEAVRLAPENEAAVRLLQKARARKAAGSPQGI